MEKTYLRSRYNTSVFVCINLVANLLFVVVGIISIKKNGEYVFDFTWLIIFTLVCFGLIFNAHFAYLGMFSRVKMTKNSIASTRIINPDRKILYKNIENISIINEMKHIIVNFEVPVIIVEGYDEISKSNAAIKIDHRDDLYENFIKLIDKSKHKELKKMDKYFDLHPK